MGMIARKASTAVLAACLGAAIPLPAVGQRVALRVPGGKFLCAGGDGTLRPEKTCPSAAECFEVLLLPQGRIALKGPQGRWLWAPPPQRILRAESPRSQPGEHESFTLLRIAENRAALRVGQPPEPVFLAAGQRGETRAAARPPAIVELFTVVHISADLRAALADIVRGLVTEELAGKQYDKSRSRRREKTVKLWAPTLRDPHRTASVRLFSIVEQYQVQARLDGPPEIQITQMAYLKGYLEPQTGALCFAAEARLPVQGRLRYAIADLLSASTGFRAVARLNLVGEIAARKSAEELLLGSPKLRELDVQVQELALSNDLLDAARRPIQDLVNQELHQNQTRIREQANRLLANAFEARQLRHPLLRFLGLP